MGIIQFLKVKGKWDMIGNTYEILNILNITKQGKDNCQL